MRVVMTLMVRDEADVLAANLEYHFARGVDFVIATDHRSREPAREVLSDYERRGLLRVLRNRDTAFRQGLWFTRMARLAATEHGADWVFHNDADEFWWPREGDLKHAFATLAGDAGVLGVPRYNFPPAPREQGPFWERLVVRDTASENVLGRPLFPKRCHRADPGVVVHGGSHRVSTSATTRTARSVPIEVFHFPWRSFGQFREGVQTHGLRFPTGMRASIPRAHVHRLLRAGLLREHWERLVVDPDEVRGGRSATRFRLDTRLRDHMRRARSSTGTAA